ncbi:DNA cytosine methyltransferase [Salmonella enterica subsp. diarizonae serovar 16:z10:e,n,x,z15]|uniref:DNA cytosine methyltransferase n=1 Tax=Salmonella enterica TaxID=28901 RepID=UPI00180B706A|nr:DNA cytosine methyltransferase [Salmonella enterica subsp. diarizonae serovar 16:z10:e,n,x,z15]MCH5505342.1 DNA cytosine methyltransferase [Salmonella enterica subsp. diarizonae serovar 16:z10:e,n,x,z15]HAG2476945.1 DNA cytosine methyltransferase [Salmonella enterica]
MREIIVDNFAGGGGASTGIEMAIGRSVDIAINHDPNAIAMHTTNHPDTLHYCESVFTVKPKIVTAGRPVALAWYSPDCRHFSKAKGAKPVEKSIRGLAWIELRWGLEVRPRVMMLENVGEFRTWGPLLAGEMRPDPERTGETFEAFIGMLTTGIQADHPALAECCEFLNISLDSEDAARLVKGLGYTVEYRELRACDYGAPTIRKRFFMVARCDGQPVVWPEPTHGDPKSEAVISGHLKPWRTAAECIDWSIPAPSIFERKKPLAENTLRRIARGIQRFVIDSEQPYIVPFIVKCNHTSSKSEYDCFRGQGLPEPLQTITKKHGYAVAVPHLTKFRTGATGQNVTDPAPTITAGSSTRPVSAFLAKHYGGNYTGPGVGLDEPAHSVTTVDHHAVVASHLVKLRGTCRDGQRTDEPAPTITAGGLHVGEVQTTLAVDEYDEQRAQLVLAFLRKYCGEDCTGLVTIGGVVYRIVDIGMRMLQPRELYRAQGFPDWYVIEHDFRGVKYAKDKQVARCGNAVPPPFSEALVRANLPELCINREEIAA